MALIALIALLPGINALAGTGTVTGLVFNDNDLSGIQDASEGALADAEITLVKVSGSSESIVNQVRADKDGQWQFSGLEAGDYYLQVSLPVDYYHVASAEGDVVMLPAQGRHSRTTVFSLTDGAQHRQDIAASKKSAYINVIAFGDLNMNGGRMSSEPLLRDVQIELLYTHAGQDYVIATGKTDREGTLQLRELTSATYKIRATMPEPYIVGPIGAKFNPFYNVVNPEETNVGTSEPFVLERSLGMGIGGVMASSLSGKVWMDSNMNGVMEDGEGGYPGLTLTLTHQSMGVTRTITTNENPDFRFEYLQAGEYSLSAELPEGVMFALPSSPSVFNDGYAQAQSVNIQVLEDKPATLAPIGVMPASSIRLFAFLDSNVNGLMDEAEPAFMNATVELLSGGQKVAEATTDAQGQAYFSRVRDGDVTIRVNLPDEQVFTIGGGDEGNLFASLTASSSLEVTKALQKGETLSLYAGATLPASISGILFDDNNLNGVLDQGEAGLGGFTVQAIDAQGQVAGEARTDASGAYLLSNLVPASYKVRVLLVSPYVFSQPSPTGTGIINKIATQTVAYGETEAVTPGPGAMVENMDAGAFRSAVINGTVLLGDEETGFTDSLGGLSDVQVTLLDENKQAVSEYTVATTDGTGKFSLKGALPGSYYLSYTLPADAKFSQPMIEETSHVSELFEVKASDELTFEPIYAVTTGTVAGQAFHDVNNNGVFDESDIALTQVTVELTNNNTLESYPVVSDGNGQYLITGIRPGSYEAFVQLPEGYVIDANDRGLVPASITGQSNRHYDIRFAERLLDTVVPALQPITIQGRAFYDNDLSETFSDADTAYKTQLTLTHIRTESSISLETDEQGQFTSEPAFPGLYQVTLSLPSDHLLTTPVATGSQDGLWKTEITLSAEASKPELAVVQLGSLSGSVWNMDNSTKDISGLEIKLLNEQGAVLQQTTTGANGEFAFKDLMPINYRLAAVLPQEYRFAREMDTAVKPSVILSDLVGVDSFSGQSEPIKLNMGENKAAQDIGMGAMGKLGDYAWLDTDRDGMQDTGEPGIPGIVIKLYQYNQLTAQTTTDQYGRYLFNKLFPGTYTLEVEMPGELKPTVKQTEFVLVASVLEPTEDAIAKAEGVIVPSGGRNLNADLGFVLRQDDVLPEVLKHLPTKDWTRINEQQPKR